MFFKKNLKCCNFYNLFLNCALICFKPQKMCLGNLFFIYIYENENIMHSEQFTESVHKDKLLCCE